MRWLKRREYSGVEMQQRLTEKGYCDSEIQSVIDDLVANGYLDNTRFVDQLVRNTQAKRNGPLWLDHMIAKHQVGDVDLESILADLAVDWYGQALEFVRKKKFFLGDICSQQQRACDLCLVRCFNKLHQCIKLS